MSGAAAHSQPEPSCDILMVIGSASGDSPVSPNASAKSKERGSNSVVECQLPKLDVAGSNPVSRSIFSITYEPRRSAFVSFASIKRGLLRLQGCEI
jgi:hypothetical protein